jgi:putative membrane protein
LLIPPPLPVALGLLVIVAAVAAYTTVVTLLAGIYHPGPLSQFDSAFAVVNAVILGTLLTFRINEAKRRWWEARTLWGQLINDTRNLCIKALALAQLGPEDRKRWGGLLVAFAESLRRQLRGGCRLQELSGFADDPHEPAHVPLYLAGLVQAEMAAWHRDGKLADIGLRLLDPLVGGLMNVCGGCERIRNTPIPSSYRALLQHGIGLNVMLAPFFLAPEVGYWSVFIMALTTYFVMGVELVAIHIEEPFGEDGDDLPLETYCRTIEQSVEQTLGA